MIASTLTTAQIAKVLNVSSRRVSQLVAEGIIRKSERGRFCLGAVSEYIRYLQDRQITAGGKAGEKGDYNAAKLRLTLAQAEAAEIEVARTRAEIVSVDQVQRTLALLFAEVRAGMRNVPTRVAASIIGMTDERAMKEILLDEIDQALTALADAPTVLPDDDADDAGI